LVVKEAYGFWILDFGFWIVNQEATTNDQCPLLPSVPFVNPLFRLSFLPLKPGVETQRHKRRKEKPLRLLSLLC
jgi:hypothetical protein